MDEVLVRYGLLHKKSGKLCTYWTSSNGGADFSVDTQYFLDSSGEHDWLVEDPLTAEYVRHNSSKWYAAGYETPTHSYKPEELVVVKVVMTMNVLPCDFVYPSDEEMINVLYHDQVRHRDHLLKELSKGRKMEFSLYDYRNYVLMNRENSK